MQGAIYDTATGLVDMVVEAPSPEDIVLQMMDRPGLAVYIGEVDPVSEYIVDSEKLDRPVMGIAEAGDVTLATNAVFRVDNIPAGTLLQHPAGQLTVDDGFFEWSSIEPGEFEFILSNFPYQTEVINAVVTEP